MDPITLIVVPALAGGVLVAWLLVRLNRGAAPSVAGPEGPTGISTDMINIAHIRGVGVGGLGLVAMCAVVAVYLPAVGISIAAGSALGAVFAVALILLRRRRTGGS